jgi:Rrf2 family iron-sulfur cluster assembly transcriptional regulator
MRLTTKGRFAVTAMIHLALREHSGPVALAAISARQQISLSYLEQLFGKDNCMGEDTGRCMTHDLWASLNTKMIEYLDSISLKSLVDEQLAKGVSIEEHPVKRAISTQPVVKPIKVNAPNSVFALGNAFSK